MPLSHHRAGSGEPLLLVHGIGSRRQFWSPVIDRLQAEHDVIAVDLPGYGASPPSPPGTPPGLDSLTGALERFLDDLGLETAHVAGSSLGGWLALELAKRGRARTVTAISPAGFVSRREEPFVVHSLRATVRSARRLEPHADRLLANPVFRTVANAQMLGRPWRVTAEDAVANVRALARAPAFDADLEALHGQDFEDGRAITVPVLILWGRRDRLLWPRQGRRAAAAIPGARLVELSGCGHLPTYDDPPLIAELIRAGTRVSC